MSRHSYICLFRIADIAGRTQINGNVSFTTPEGGVRYLLRLSLATFSTT